MLVEVNPLIVTADREVKALDAKVTLDDNALFRHKENAELRDPSAEDPQEQMAKERGLIYVKLDGDIGILGEDGHLSVVDRAKDMLLYKGYNVFPRELEELLAARPEVRTAAVVGLPDDAVGELPTAALVLAPGAGDVAGLAAAVNGAVRPYERLRRIYTVDALPVSAAGKVLKGDLRETLLASEDGPVWTDGGS